MDDGRCERWLMTFAGLADYNLRAQFARSELERDSAVEVAAALNALARASEQNDVAARDTLCAFLPTLVDVAALPRLAAIRAAAQAQRHPSASRLLRATHAIGHLREPRSASRKIADQAEDNRELTLGERRALARGSSRRALDKLLRDPHPMVARVLLGNPRITEHDAVGMASRRPAMPEVISEIAKVRCHQQRVRLAIVLNPGAPPAVTIPLLSQLRREELAQSMRAVDLPNILRVTAGELHELRPPLDPHDDEKPRH